MLRQSLIVATAFTVIMLDASRFSEWMNLQEVREQNSFFPSRLNNSTSAEDDPHDGIKPVNLRAESAAPEAIISPIDDATTTTAPQSQSKKLENQLLVALSRFRSQNAEGTYAVALGKLETILSNIVNFPGAKKHSSIPASKAPLGSGVEGEEEILTAFGFRRQGDKYVMVRNTYRNRDKMLVLQSVKKDVKKATAKEEANENPFSAALNNLQSQNTPEAYSFALAKLERFLYNIVTYRAKKHLKVKANPPPLGEGLKGENELFAAFGFNLDDEFENYVMSDKAKANIRSRLKVVKAALKAEKEKQGGEDPLETAAVDNNADRKQTKAEKRKRKKTGKAADSTAETAEAEEPKSGISSKKARRNKDKAKYHEERKALGSLMNFSDPQTSASYKSLSAEELANIRPDRSWRPTNEWVNSCTAELAQNKTLQRPFASWRNTYGLGDCIKMCARCMQGEIDSKDQNLAKQYKRKACYLENPNYVSGGNLTVVEHLLEDYGKRNNPPLPSPESLVLHLRVGDVIEKSKQSTEELLISGGDPWHTDEFKSSIKSIHEYLENIAESESNQVVIIGGSYKSKDYARSRVYAGCLERAIREAGYHVSMDLDAPDADLDFYFMSHASKLVVSSGGYSNLIAKIMQRRGGKVIGRTFDDPDGVKTYELQNWGLPRVNFFERRRAKANGRKAIHH